MQHYARAASWTFGVMMLLLTVAVTLETLLRKLFSFSLGGVDELSGYAIALGAPLAFTVALIQRSHIRINLLYLRLQPKPQAWLDAVATLTLGVLAIFLFVFTVKTVWETHQYQSIAQTPWATPLIYPQSLWLIAMLAFALPAAWIMLQAVVLLVQRNWSEMTRRFGPESIDDELKAELEDLQRR